MGLSTENQKQIEQAGLQAGLNINHEIMAKLDTYCNQVMHWIKMHNVTGLRSIDHVVRDGIIDTIYMVPYLVGQRILDIGSGAGLPGMIISILCPQLQVTMTEQRSKKLAFLKRGVRICQLGERVSIIDARTQKLRPEYACVTSRAFSGLEQTFNICKEAMASGARIVLPRSGEETEECLKLGARVFTYQKYDNKQHARILAIFDVMDAGQVKK